MRWRRWAKSLISYPGRWAQGDLWWEGLFQLYNGRDGNSRLLCEVWVPSNPQKRDIYLFLLLRCDCGVPLLILKRMMMVQSPPDPVLFTGPQTESCKSIKSSERSTGFGCDNDLQKTTNGERMCPTHTWTPSTPPLRASWVISALMSDLTHTNTHPYCASCRLRWRQPW